MSQRKSKIKTLYVSFFDFLIDFPIIGMALSVILSAIVNWQFSDIAEPVLVTSLKSAASVSFALFGFAIAAVSILAALKTTPFMDAAEKNNYVLFKATIDHFIKTAAVLFLWGLFGLFLPESLITEKNRPGFMDWVLFLYSFLMLFSLYLSLSSSYLLRLLVVARKE